ncbi:MAG: phosphoribulokinase [Rhodospirillaceae bacterium]|nr:phosphoribulokinase [Rhodospirillaceae bacterium]
MSKKYPVIAVTGSSGAGTSTVKESFEHMFRREGINPAVIEGDSFHRFNRAEMKRAVLTAEAAGNKNFSHFGPQANEFKKLEELFATYGRTGSGKRRLYLHSDEEAKPYAPLKAGEFTPWQDIPKGTDLLFYEGLHGAVVNEDVNVPKHVDLNIGVVPVINLEWIQKIHRDTKARGYSEEAVMDTILRRMHDYVHYIVPQFKHSDINFQRVAVVDTSDPIIARDIPTPDESVVVIRFRKPEDLPGGVDFPFLLQMIQNSYMSRRNTIVIPGAKMGLAMELILTPILRELMVAKGGINKTAPAKSTAKKAVKKTAKKAAKKAVKKTAKKSGKKKK